MLKAHWSGFEIDSSEAAYSIKVDKPEELGALVRAILGSGYFVRSYYLLFDEPLRRLLDYVKAHEPAEAKIRQTLDEVVGRMKDDRAITIGVRAIEPILNYVGANAQGLLAAKTFHFEPTADQKALWQDYDITFKPGSKVNEENFYSEHDLPLDGVVLYLGCQLVGLDKLTEEEQDEAEEAIRETDQMIQEEEGEYLLEEEEEGEPDMIDVLQQFHDMIKQLPPQEAALFDQMLARYDLTMANVENFLRMMQDMSSVGKAVQRGDFLPGPWGDEHSYWDNYEQPQDISLRVRMDPKGKLSIHGRWMDDGQFAYGYYDYVLGRVAEKVGTKISLTSIY